MQSLLTSLDSLSAGNTATIVAIEAEDGLLNRLAALGFRIGKSIEVIRTAAFNGPMHVRIGTTEIALRRSEAKRIQIHH